MFYSPKLYFKDPYIIALFLLSFSLLGWSWWVAVQHFPKSAETVFLHYTIIFGIDFIGEWWKGWLIPGFSSAVFVFNSLISFVLYQRSKFLSRFWLGLTLGVVGCVTVGLAFIVGLNS